jgi:hypothetical protein
MALTKVKAGNILLTTPGASSNDVTPATTAYVTTALANLADSAPSTLDTLNELAAALGDDANFSTTVTNSIAAKLPLAGGTMTGNITLGDNNKAIFGAGSDLQIYHDGSNSYIVDGNSGSDLLIQSNNIVLENTSGHNMIHMASGGAVQLYHNNVSKVKTTATGAQIGLNNSTITRLQLYGATNAEHQIKFGNDGTNGEKDGAIRYFGEAHGTTANRRAMTFSTATNERMRIDSSGNLLLGTTSLTPNYDGGIRVHSASNVSNIRVSSGDKTGFDMMQDTGGTAYVLNRDNAGMNFYTNNTQRMTIDSSGDVGIGMTSPQRKFEVSTANAEMSHFGQIAGTNGHYTGITLGYREDNTNYRKAGIIQEQIGDGAARGHLHLCVDTGADNNSIDTADSKLMIHGTSGNVGIGTTSPGRVLEVSHSANSHTPVLRLSGMSTSAYSGGLSWYSGYGPKETAEMHSTASGSNGGEWWLNVRNQNSNTQTTVMAVNNVGRLRLNGVSAACSGAFNVMGEVGNSYDAIQFYHNSATLVGRIRTAASSTSYNTSSDYRLKENVDYTWDATTRLKQLKPARFNFIADDTNTLVDGFLAHEVSSVVPEAITGTKDAVDGEGNPDYQGIDQSKLVPLLVKGMQEQQALIESLTARIATLEE